MNLYLQVFTQIQSRGMAELIIYPSQLQFVEYGCQVKMSAGGRVSKLSFDSISQASESLKTKRFNQLEISYQMGPRSNTRFPQRIKSLVGLFTPSPTCELWFKSSDWPTSPERAMRTRRVNAEAAEGALAFYKVTRKPSIYEVVVELGSPRRDQEVLDDFAEWLANGIPNSLAPLKIFGCVDLGGKEFFVKLESNVLMTAGIRVVAELFPPAYPELGRRFDSLHPIMFGSKDVFNGLAGALGTEARMLQSPVLPDFAVLRMNGNWQTESVKERAGKWLLPPGFGSRL